MKIASTLLIGMLTILLTCTSFAVTQKPITMDEAFSFSATARDAQTLVVHFKIRPGFYLYKNHMQFRLENPDEGKLDKPIFPIGMKKNIDEIGIFEVYTDVAQIGIPFMPAENTKSVDLITTYQGCSDDGYCYPPNTKVVHLDLTGQFGEFAKGKTIETVIEEIPLESNQDKVTSLLTDQTLITILLSFFGFGLLLAFTPCVLPMIPILSSIIVGQKEKLKTKDAFLLSLTYILAMSVTYALAGMLVGYVGGSVQALFQQPWIIVLSSMVFLGMAMSLFGFYELQLPRSWQNKLTNVSNKQKGGTYVGVALMGALATLIVSPCVTPALVGALGYIGKTGNAILGGAALFTLGLGMGTPLLIIGTAGGQLLPKAGIWMNSVSKFIGVLMIAMAIWLLDRILPGQYTMALWGALLIISATFLGVFKTICDSDWQRLWKGCGMVMLIYGSLLILGSAMGNKNPLHPLIGLHLAHHQKIQTANEEQFDTVKNIGDLNQAVKKSSKVVLLDFYADWCVSCKVMQKTTLSDPRVISLLKKFTIVKANVTKNNFYNKELQQHYGVIAPPTFVFISPDGGELTKQRIVGEMSTDEFILHLKSALKQSQSLRA